MGLFSKVFGKSSAPAPPSAEAEAPESVAPDAVVVLRHGLSRPTPEYVAQVLAAAFAPALPATLPKAGLSQPTWPRTPETLQSAAADAAAALGEKLGVPDASFRHRALAGPDGARVLVVELRRG